MKKIIFGIMVLSILACNRASSDGYVTVDVIEVMEVSSYTYLLVKEKRTEYWIAVAAMSAEPGDTYKYKGGLLMNDFYSEELDKTFEEVLFLDQLLPINLMPGKQDMADIHGMVPGMKNDGEKTPGSTVVNKKSDVNVESVEGAITISQLFADMKAYEGKTVRIVGEVTKFNAAIMNRNWVHLQDGTEYEGKYDLTATSMETFEVGSTVILEGIVSLDHDFGYGYSYELLVEKATAVK